MEFLEVGGRYTWLALLTIMLAWTGSVWRAVRPGRDYGLAAAGGWILLGGVLEMCLAAATLVPPHTSILMTVFSGLGPPLLVVMAMAFLIVLDGIASWFNPPSQHLPSRVARWSVMALVLSGLGLLMELRTALALHMAMNHSTIETAGQSVEGWFHLARLSGGVAALLGLMMMVDGLVNATPIPSSVEQGDV